MKVGALGRMRSFARGVFLTAFPGLTPGATLYRP